MNAQLFSILALALSTAQAISIGSSRKTRDDPQPLPIWHRQFTIQLNETTKIFLTKHTEGTWYYDADAGLEALYRANGIGDRYCGSVHPLSNTPCAHIVADSKRYLVFPDLGECCMCCTAAQGCGILSPSWLQGASFEGTVETQGVPAYKWRRDGLQPNYYFATANEAQVPLELDQMPNDRQTLWPDTFRSGAPPPGVFQLPVDCKPRCPLTSVCTIASLL